MHWLNSLDVFLLILIRHLDVSPAWLEVNGLRFAELIIFYRKCLVNDIRDVVVAVTQRISSIPGQASETLTVYKSNSYGTPHQHPPYLGLRPSSSASFYRMPR